MASSTSVREPKSNSLRGISFRPWTPVSSSHPRSRCASSLDKGRRPGECNPIAFRATLDEVEEHLTYVLRAAAALIHEARHGPESLVAGMAPGGWGLPQPRESCLSSEQHRVHAPDRASIPRLCARRSSMAWIGVLGTILLPAIFASVTVKPPLLSFGNQQAGDNTLQLTSSSSALMQDVVQQRSELELRLVVNESLGSAGEPVPLGLGLQGRPDGAVVLITGLIPGMSLSSGKSISGHTWAVSAADLASTWVGPPVGFVGVVSLAAELQVDGSRVIDRQPVRIEWIAAAASTAQVRATTAVSESGSALQDLAQDEIALEAMERPSSMSRGPIKGGW
jgi:hypothetical protein